MKFSLILAALIVCALIGSVIGAPHHHQQHHAKAASATHHAPKHHASPSHHHSVNGDNERIAMVHAINSAQTSWKAKLNPRFAGKPISAIKRQLGVKLNGNKLPLKVHTGFDMGALPASFDSREAWPECPTIKEIRDQSDCGSCWAFGAVEAASDRICIGTNGTQNAHLSATDLLSCCTACGDGCNGGDPGSAWQYLQSPGVVTGGNYNDFSLCSSYPFENCEHHNNHTTYPSCPSLNNGQEYATPACPTACDPQSTYKVPFSQDAHVFATAYSVGSTAEQIQVEIQQNGPVEAAFDVYADFEQYSSGVYQHTTGEYLGGHAVKIIGWGVDAPTGLPYWLVANSWNQDWGENGFFRILRGSDECGIEDNIVAGLYL